MYQLIKNTLLTTIVLFHFNSNLFGQSCAPFISNNTQTTNHKIEITIRSLNGDSLNTYICSASNNGGNNYSLSCDLNYLTSTYGNNIYFDYRICNGNSSNCVDCYYNSDGSQTVLPIELLEFKVVNNGDNFISWTTLTERNNYYFTLEHSNDGENWQTKEIVTGAGTTTLEQTYHYIDSDFEHTINYYRLTQTDFDGSSQTFFPIMIDNSGDAKLIKTVNSIGQEVNENYQGLIIECYSDGSTVKRIR